MSADLAIDDAPAATWPDRRGALRSRALPAWPFTSLFVLYPVWWLLGLAPMIVPLLGTVCLFLMTMRGQIRLPRLWLWWLAFLGWSLVCVVHIDSGGRLVGFAQRWCGLVGATLLVVYVYNSRENLTRRRVLRAFSVMLGWVSLGGYLGMAFPWQRISTPVLAALPQSLAGNDYVHELLSPRFAEVQHPYGAVSAFVRPSAPFPYTNGWGHAFVLLMPVAAAAAVHATRRTRLILALLAASAVPPALATLNRGIFVGVGVTLFYLGARYARRASLRRLLQVGAAVAVTGSAVLASGALDRISQRTTASSTTEDRASLYREAFDRTLESPLIGWGGPRPSGTLDVSVGTQGHFWYLMFSYGFVGLGLYLAFVWGLAVVTRSVTDLESTCLHAVIVCVGVMLMFYGVDSLHLIIATTCGVLLLRPESPRTAAEGSISS